MERIVIYNGSREIYGNMATSAKSLLAHTPVDRVYFLIEDDAFPEELPEVICCINARESILKYFDPHGPNYFSQWTPIGLARYCLTKIFPDIDRALAIDADTIVTGDISALLEMDLGDCYVAMARETGLSARRGIFYPNAGVMMMDLARLRETGADDLVIRELNETYHPYTGQDVMSVVFRGHILDLPSEYNSCKFTAPTSTPKILHFADRRDWTDLEVVRVWRERPWSEVVR